MARLIVDPISFHRKPPVATYDWSSSSLAMRSSYTHGEDPAPPGIEASDPSVVNPFASFARATLQSDSETHPAAG